MFIALAVLLLIFQGCVDGDLSKRNDGKMASEVRSTTESPCYEARLQAEAERLSKQIPSLSRKDAYTQARKNIGPDMSVTTTGPTAKELKDKAAQEKFEDDLNKMKREH